MTIVNTPQTVSYAYSYYIYTNIHGKCMYTKHFLDVLTMDPSLQTRSLHWLNQYFNFYTDILLFFMSYKIIDIVLYTHSIDDTYIINPEILIVWK